MIICHCHAVSDRRIRKAVRQGASNLRDVQAACRAGASCGGCLPAVDQILREERRREQEGAASEVGPVLRAVPG
jgi:bacterioferritin-associated ferredoxin